MSMTFSGRFQCLTAALFVCFAATVQSASQAADEAPANKPHVLLMIGEDEYQTEKTLPVFVREQLEPAGVRCTIVEATLDAPNDFPGLEQLKEADLLLVSVRRRPLSKEQMQLVRDHLAAGKPLVGIRTASHAFALRQGEAPEGYVQWPAFDQEVLGCRYEGHLANRDGTSVATMPRAEQHEILTGVKQTSFTSSCTLYRSHDLPATARPLLRGLTTENNQPVSFPVAWTNTYGKSRVFYTSLGDPGDFQNASFQRILLNAVFWAMKLPPPGSETAQASDRDRYQMDIAANDEVAEIIRTFEGKGEIGDDSLPTPAEQAVRQFQVHGDFEIELVAAEPQIEQPLYMSFDHRGRMWVVQYRQYPFPAGLKVLRYDQYLRAVFDKVPEPPPHHVQGADKITVLEDTDGDGTFDSVKDAITGLNIVSAVLAGHDGIWVLNPPYLLFYPDADGDDVPDGDPEVHLSGFGLEDTHSVANSLQWGPDGWIYGANGSTTTGTISSAVTKNVSFMGQMVWRYHPKTKVFEIYAEGGGNTFSLEIDSVGRVFSGTNNGATRGMFYSQGGYAQKNWGKHGPLTNPYALGYYDHMRHEGYEERFTQAFCIYEGGALPEQYECLVFAPNSLHNRVLASALMPDTSSFRTKDLPPLVMTGDRWFRPVDIKVGPDGAMYMADWYDSRLTHVDPRDNWHKTSGRIYRLKAKGAEPLAPFNLAKLSDDELIELFSHRNKWFRQTAVRLLGERASSETLPKLKAIATDNGSKQSLEALWALHWAGGLTNEVATSTLAHSSPHVRRWTVRLLGDSRDVSPSLAAQMAEMAVSEPDAEVRSQLASSAKRFKAAEGLPIVRSLLARNEDLEDLHIPLLLWWAIEDKAVSDRDAVLALLEDSSLWRLPIVEQHVLGRIMQRYAMAGGDENLRTCARLLDLAPGPQDASRLMAGLEEAFRGRQITGLPKELSEALDRYQEQSTSTDLALAMRLGNKTAIDKALQLIADPQTRSAERFAAIEILGQIKEPRAVDALLKLLDEPDAASLHRVALGALASFDREDIGLEILRRWSKTLLPAGGVRETALRVVASRKPWALALIDRLDRKAFRATSVPIDIVQQMALHNDKELNAGIARHWGRIRGSTPAEKQVQIDRLSRLIGQGHGDMSAGQKIFTEHCGKCHTLFGQGGQTGPELTGYERDNLGFMLLAVVDPSAAIREEFTNWMVVTTDGRTLTGLVVERGPLNITLRDVENRLVLVNNEDIELMQALETSIMPDGVMDKLSDQQVRDLFTYLMARTPGGLTSAGSPAGAGGQ